MAVQAKPRALLTPDQQTRIAEALSPQVVLDRAGSDLKRLSDMTEIDEVDVITDMIDGTATCAKGIFNVYVVLKYQKPKVFESYDSFPGSFTARIDPGGAVVFDEVKVDTSAFYA
ncbi:MAG: hypothetical protein RLY86_3419 [Pseudomonadota bacterium]|jgi:hypothetical protein